MTTDYPIEDAYAHTLGVLASSKEEVTRGLIPMGAQGVWYVLLTLVHLWCDV